MEKYKIGQTVSFNVEGLAHVGMVTDILEVDSNTLVYVVETRVGVFNLNENGKVII